MLPRTTSPISCAMIPVMVCTGWKNAPSPCVKSGMAIRNRSCELLVIDGKLHHCLSLLGNDPNEGLCRLCKFAAGHQPVRTFWCRQTQNKKEQGNCGFRRQN